MIMEKHSHNFQLLLDEIASRGILIDFVKNTDVVKATIGDHTEFLWNGLTRLTPAVYRTLMNDKFYAKAILLENNFAVANGQVFSPHEKKLALSYAYSLGFPVVLKPTNACSGDLVFAHIINEDEFNCAFMEFSKHTQDRNMLVEKHFAGDDYQFILVDQKGFAVAKRTLPTVVGDGIATIQELVNEENHRRMNPRNSCLCEIFVADPDGLRALKQQGLSLDSVLESGRKVHLRLNANVSWGAYCEQVTKKVHPSYIDILKRILSLFPGAGFIIVDILASDITKEANSENHIITEFNAKPAWSLYQQPAAGEPHYIVKDLVDLLFPETDNPKVNL